VLGQPPGGESSPFQVAVNARGRLSDPEEFASIVIKTGDRGEIVRLGDVARVELGANQYSLRSLLNGKPAVGIQVFQSADASAIAVSDSVRETLERLSASFPPGVEYQVAYDPTIFVRAS